MCRVAFDFIKTPERRREKKANGCKKHPWLNMNIESHVEGFISMSRLKFYLTQHWLYIDFSFSSCPVKKEREKKSFSFSARAFFSSFFLWEMLSVYIVSGREKMREDKKLKNRLQIFFLFFSSTRYLTGSFTCRVSWYGRKEGRSLLRLC